MMTKTTRRRFRCTIRFLGAVIALLTNTASHQALAADTFVDVASYAPLKDVVPEAQWGKLANPAQAGWASSGVSAITSYADSIGTDSLLVIFRGNVVIAHGAYADRFKIHSLRKSLMSAMYGIHTDRGSLDTRYALSELGINDRLGLTTGEKRATVANLLTSMSGVYHPAAYETSAMEADRPARGSYAPGTYWYYNNWDFNTLVTIFNQETGKDFFSAFQSDLATPLQMQHFRLQDAHYHYESDKSVHPAYLFEMSAPDLARLGLLYLRRGMWGSKQVISKDWIDLSTSAIYAWEEDSPSYGYGYLWYAEKSGFYAAGKGGNRISVVPRHNLVIVHQVDTKNGKSISSSDVDTLSEMIVDKFDASAVVYPSSGGTVTISFARLGVDSDTTKSGAQVNNVIPFADLSMNTSNSYAHLVAIVGDEDQTFESDEVGYNLSDFENNGWVHTLATQNTSTDPVLIRAYGRIDSYRIGNLTPKVRFHRDIGFGVRSGPDTSNTERWLDHGDAVDFRINDLSGGTATELNVASFVVRVHDDAAPGTTVNVVLDVDGNTLEDTNGASGKGGFVTHELATLASLRNGDQVKIDFTKRNIYVNGIVVPVSSLLWHSFESTGRRNITIGAPAEEEVGFAVWDLQLNVSDVVNIAEALQ